MKIYSKSIQTQFVEKTYFTAPETQPEPRQRTKREESADLGKSIASNNIKYQKLLLFSVLGGHVEFLEL